MKTVKKALVAVLAMVMMITTVVMPVAAANFTDTQDHWAKDHINRWVDAGVLNGMTETTFNPQGDLTRGQLAKIFATMLGLSEEGENNLTDISDHWAKPFILQCAKAGIIMGYEDSTFRPERPVTRQEAYVMVARAMKITSGNADNLDGFSDADKIATWAKDAMSAARSFNALDGSNGAANPEGNITRAEVAALLDKLVTVYVHDGKVSLASTIKDGEAISSLVVVKEDETSEVKVSVDVDDTTGDIKVTVNANGTEKVVTVPAEKAEEIKEKAVVVLGGKVAEVKDDSSVQTDHKDDDHADFVTPEEPKPPVVEDPECDGNHETVFVSDNCAAGGKNVTVCEVCEVEDEEMVDPTFHKFGEDGECTVCGMSKEVDEADLTGDAVKFFAKVASNGEYAKAVVTNDYVAEIEITPGKVDPKSVDLSVKMQNVASMGVENIRKANAHISTDIEGDPALNFWFGNIFKFTKGTIIADVNGESVSYTMTGNKPAENEAVVITAQPNSVDAARKAWAELTDKSHMTSGTHPTDDSYIEIQNGSYIMIGKDKLSFEKEVGNLKLDNFTGDNGIGGLESEIRSKVQLNTNQAFADELAKEEVDAKFYLAAGTTLAVGQSYVTLDDNCTITFKGTGDAFKKAEFTEALTELKNAQGNKAIVERLVRLLDQIVAAADDGNGADGSNAVYVNITYTEKEEAKARKFFLAMDADTVGSDVPTEVSMEVFDDYSLEINLPLNEISAKRVGLYVEMNDVASMGVKGEKSHRIEIEDTGINKTGDLSFWMSNASEFNEATVNATIIDGPDTHSVQYALKGDLDADWATITGTPANEDATRIAWLAIAEHFNTEDGNPAGNDSYFSIAKGSELIVGAEKLTFEEKEGNDALVLDNFNSLSALKDRIKNAVMLTESGVTDGSIILKVAKGTALAVGESCAVLKDDVEIVVKGITLEAGTLANLQAHSNDNYTLVQDFFTILNNAVGKANNNHNINVTVTFK